MAIGDDIKKSFNDNKEPEKFLMNLSKYDCSICKHREINSLKCSFYCKIMSITQDNINDIKDCPNFVIDDYFKDKIDK